MDFKPPTRGDTEASMESTSSEYSVIAITSNDPVRERTAFLSSTGTTDYETSSPSMQARSSRIRYTRRPGQGGDLQPHADTPTGRFNAQLAQSVQAHASSVSSGQSPHSLEREYREIHYYRENQLRLALFYCLCVLPLPIPGIFLLFSRWFPELFTWVAREKLDHRRAHLADCVLVRGPIIE
ncbi:hypothetical protein HDU93_005315, partial [Gonapodya sp. JEL0774]